MRRAKQLSGAAAFKGYPANNAWLVTVHNVIGPLVSTLILFFGKENKVGLSRN